MMDLEYGPGVLHCELRKKIDWKPRILVLNPTCLDVIEQYREWTESQEVELVADQSFRQLSADQMRPTLVGAHAVVIPSVVPLTALDMSMTPTLRVLSLAGSGYERVDVQAATSSGIVVTNAPIREGAEVVADLTWGLILSVARQIPYHSQLVARGQYVRGMGVAVWRKTLGILGLGNIGRAVARRAKAFEMRVLTASTRSYLSNLGANRERNRKHEMLFNPDLDFLREHNIELVSFDDLLRGSDFVSLHVRLSDETKGLIGQRELSLMKPSAYLINTARGQLVEETALTEAVLNNRIAGAAMDDPLEATDSPLFQLPNFVSTPHLGNRAIEGVRAVCKCALENALTVVRGHKPDFVVNPEVYEEGLRPQLGTERIVG